MFKFFYIYISLLLLIVDTGFAQKTIVYGRVKDAANGDPVPFANVIFKGTTTGTTTKFDGRFRIETTQKVDSVIASYIGYKQKTFPIRIGVQQKIDFQLTEEILNLKEVVFVAEENPAFAIMRKVIKHKKKNDKESLSAYEYDSYVKAEVDVDNITDKFKKNKHIRKIVHVLDSIEIIAGEDGKPILPIFFSEAISKYYVRNNPKMRHEYILKTKVTGVGFNNESFVSQIIGSTYQDYNFYENYMTIIDKEFASPLVNEWKRIYNYYLIDSMMIGKNYTYRIDFEPKRKNDLAFKGTMWITKKGFALKQIDAAMTKKANFNYIEGITIRQQLIKSQKGPWLPSKTRVLIDVAQPTETIAGLLAKIYISNKNFVINKPRDKSFYNTPIDMDEEVGMSDDLYWEQNRHEELSKSEINVYHMVDTLKKIPSIKRFVDLLKFAFTGFYNFKKIKIGPYPLFLSFNNIEGLRLGFGGETTYNFSNKWIFKGIIGYGFKDNKWKYKVGVDYVISRKPWIKTGIEIREDVDPVYLIYRDINYKGIFYALNRFGVLLRPFQHFKLQYTIEKQLIKDINSKVTIRYDRLDPVFDFAYYSEPTKAGSTEKKSITTTEAHLQFEWAKGRKYLIKGNKRISRKASETRISRGIGKHPIVRVNFTTSIPFKNIDFQYQKIGFHIIKKIKFGELGTSFLQFAGEYIFGSVPYPILQNHLGNETPIYTASAYNLMNNFEFTSDRFLSMNYSHHFGGKILNYIPFIRSLKLRLVGEAKILYGGMRQENKGILVPKLDASGKEIEQFGTLNPHIPYIELGYGIENILKIIRIDFFHRLTYTDQPSSRNFGAKIGLQFIF